jgi:hypothetical protein
LSQTLAYIESGIWIAKGLGSTDKFYNSSRLFVENNIETGRIKGIVSLISLMETIDVIRTRITSNINKNILDNMSDKRREEYIKNLSEEKMRILLTYLRTKETENKILFADFSIIDLKNIFENSFQFSKNFFGHIPFRYKCGRCWQDYQHYEYKGLGNTDILHAFLAKEYFCNLFVTTDTDYKDIQGSPIFPDLNFLILDPSR